MYGAITRYGRTFQTVPLTLFYASFNQADLAGLRPRDRLIIVVLQHRTLLANCPVWAVPSSLATTIGITVVFSSSGY